MGPRAVVAEAEAEAVLIEQWSLDSVRLFRLSQTQTLRCRHRPHSRRRCCHRDHAEEGTQYRHHRAGTTMTRTTRRTPERAQCQTQCR